VKHVERKMRLAAILCERRFSRNETFFAALSRCEYVARLGGQPFRHNDC
jgi:hypothetical protein